MQAYKTLMALPVLFRMFFGIIVDAKVIKERKYYVIIINALSAYPMYVIATSKCETAETMAMWLFVHSTLHQFLEATAASLSVEQARLDPVHGQEDFQSLKTSVMGFSFTIGSIIVAYILAIKMPWIAFAISTMLYLL